MQATFIGGKEITVPGNLAANKTTQIVQTLGPLQV